MRDAARFAAREAELGPLLDAVERAAQALGASREVVAKLRIIAEELFLNTLTHGGGAGQPGASVALAVEREGGCLWLRYEDEGPAYDPFAAPPPHTAATLEERGVGGLGIVLVKHFAAATHYAREADRNRIEVALRLDAAAASDAGN